MYVEPSQLDTMDDLMAGYVAGNLPYPIHILVASHIEIIGESKHLATTLEELAGQSLLNQEPVEIDDSARALEEIYKSQPQNALNLGENFDQISQATSGVIHRALQEYAGFDPDNMPWRTKMPGFKEISLAGSNTCEAKKFWIRPGRAIPEHTHDGYEFTLVLEGGFSDNIGQYERGSIAVANPNITHRPVADNDTPCIGFAVTTGKLKPSGTLSNTIVDVLGLGA